jgi:RNA polymerase sigma factor (sigma-70 family)
VGERTTAELVAGARDGDRSAWDLIVERYSGLVWSVARAHRLGPSDAADVFQTTWLRLVEHIDRIREPEHLGGWLSATARHEALRLLRVGSRETLADDIGERADADPVRAEPMPSPESVVLATERRAEVLLAMGRLSPRCQTLLRLLATDPAPSYAEVSEALDMPVGSIGPTRGRCLQHLRDLLESPPRGPGT